ncbi:hypothetical protein Cgig2_010723 [Carnegiea gigantea]|uniref:Uncharacterized protein n=1 Tax=Carnegiea gigantea TaxID=171969 RepID=A0A9Q1QMC0_9CARY|nr:hypothetical protein Cgig2_010723 [Carnegiea gigantea]
MDQPGRMELHMSQENIAPTNLDFVLLSISYATIFWDPSVAASLASLHFIPGSSVFPNAATMAMLGYSKYVKLWEGCLHGQKQGKAVLISKIAVYRTTVASSICRPSLSDSVSFCFLQSNTADRNTSPWGHPEEKCIVSCNINFSCHSSIWSLLCQQPTERLHSITHQSFQVTVRAVGCVKDDTKVDTCII